ncbi:MAG: hypothetical protein CL927_08115 [Deltaproteobacteria bacterium]|nr:hypothetical protein [Deltaproteobacteria bacterium]HCH61677.1 hypothetical protein [Deltaproteobacteria bacterium]
MLTGCKALVVPTCDEPEGTACFRGVFRTLIGKPVEDVNVCAPDFDDIACTRSDENGGWKIPGLPVDTDVVITATHPDMVPTLFAQNTSMSWYEWYKVAVPPDLADKNAERLGLTARSDRGNVLFLTWEGLNIDGNDTNNVEDVTAEVDGGGSLFYGNALTLADPGLNATSGSGSGGLVNVPPGTIDLRLRAPAGRCAQDPMFHFAAQDGWIPVPIRAGWNTAMDVMCPAR